ncbi:sodium/hydrogen exchanger 6 [Tanacetum coccineum]
MGAVYCWVTTGCKIRGLGKAKSRSLMVPGLFYLDHEGIIAYTLWMTMQVLEKQGLFGKKSLGKLDFCENYVLGKSHRVSFGVRRHTTRGVIDYVHSDLWDPSQVESLGEALLDWIMDSGCSYHMTPMLDIFFDFLECDGGSVLLGDNKECKITGLGKVRVQLRDRLSFMLHNVRVVLSGPRRDNCVYSLDDHVVAGELNASVEEKDRLVQDPSQVESLGGKKYFLSIIDDYSRRVWVYIIRFKHKAIGKFKEWKQSVENQTRRTVKKLRMDNGLKFCNWEFEQLCIESWIAKHLTGIHVEVELHGLNNRTLEEDHIDQEDGDDEEVGGRETDQTSDLIDYQLVRDREPRIRMKALSSKLKTAMKEVMDSLRKNKTWELVDHPGGQKLGSYKWLFKIKEGIKGVQNPRYNARLVARGFTQKADINYNELDVKTIFLHENLEEVVCIRQPPGYEQATSSSVAVETATYITRVMHQEFDMKELGKAKKILDDGKLVQMSLGGHFKMLLKDCPVKDCDVERMSKVPYANMVGSLMYLMVCTRPDIAYAVSIISKYLANPGFVDSDYAKDPNKEAVRGIQQHNATRVPSKPSSFVEDDAFSGLTKGDQVRVLTMAGRSSKITRDSTTSFGGGFTNPTSFSGLHTSPSMESSFLGFDEVSKVLTLKHDLSSVEHGFSSKDAPWKDTLLFSTTKPLESVWSAIDINANPTTYAGAAGAGTKDQTKFQSNFRSLVADKVFDGVNTSIPRKVVEKINSEADFKESITIGIPDLECPGCTKETIRVEYEWKPPRCHTYNIFGNTGESCPKKVVATPVVNNTNDAKGFQVGKEFNYQPKATSAGTNVGSTRSEASSKAGSSKDNICSMKKMLWIPRQALLLTRFLMFSVASWNKRGLNHSLKQKEVRHVVNENNLSVCAILESHVDVAAVYDTCKKVNTHADNKTLFCSLVYADNYYIDHRALWSNLVGHARLTWNKPWILLGDFNAALNLEDHSSSGYEQNAAMHDFKECVQAIEIILLVFSASQRVNVEGFAIYRVVKQLKGLESLFRKLLHDHGNLHERVNKIRVELEEAQKAIDMDPFLSNLCEEHAHYLLAFKEAQLDEERFLKQKAKVEWLKAGDLNTTYFHRTVKSKCARNRIEMVCDTSNIFYDGNQVPSAFVAHYDQFLGTKGVTNPLDDHDLFIRVLDTTKADYIVRNVTDDEKAWNVVGGDITCAIWDFFSIGKLLKELNHTIIALIPKVTTLARDIISINQSAFVSGRRISNNILLTQELMKNYHRRHGPPRCAFKVDIQKAFDIVDWKFLETILVGFGFHPKMIPWIMVYVSGASYSICVNGNLHGYFKGKRVIMDALEEFKQVLGLVPSIPKSIAFFCNVPNSIKAFILNSIPFAEGALPVWYLGVPLISSRLLYRDCKILVEKLESKGMLVGMAWADVYPLKDMLYNRDIARSVFSLDDSVPFVLDDMDNVILWRDRDGVLWPFSVACKLKTQDRLRQWDVGPSIDLNLLRIVVAATSYYIWLERNGRLFKKKTSSPDQIVQVILSMVRLKSVTFKFKKMSILSHLLLDQWKIPSYCIIYDGKVLEAKTIKVLKVETEHNAADALMKMVPRRKLQHCLELLSVGVG